MLGIGLGLTQCAVNGSGIDPDAQAYFDAVAATGTPLIDEQKAIINVFFMEMKANSLFTKNDGGNFLCLTTPAQCFVDFKVPSRVATVYSSPTWVFTENRQFMGSGSVDTVNLPDSINTGVTPSTAGGLFSQNSAHLSVYRIQSGGTVSARIFAGANGTPDLFLYPRLTGDIFTGRNNNGTTESLLSGITDGNGFFLLSREGAASSFAQWNSTQSGTITTASTGIPNAPIRYLQTDGVFGALATEGISYCDYGGGLTPAEGLIANNIITKAITALRAL